MILFPPPHNMTTRNRLCDYSSCRWITLPAQAGFELKEAARRIAATLSARFLVPPEVTAGKPGAGCELLRMERDFRLPPEGYRLETSPDGALLAAATDTVTLISRFASRSSCTACTTAADGASPFPPR